MVKQCEICGAEFNATKRTCKYCSDACKHKGLRIVQGEYRQRKREERALGISQEIVKPKPKVKRKWQKPKFNPKKCVACGKEYIPNSGQQKYCSYECKFPNLPRYNMAVKPLSGLPLDNQKAWESDMTYGQWRGLQILQKEKEKQERMKRA